jgi:hypothetical protein
VADSDIVGSTTVPERDIQVVVVRTKGDRAAIVIRLRLIDLEHDPLRIRIGHVRVRRDGELRDVARVIEVRRSAGAQWSAVVHVELAVGGVVRVEGEAQEAPLAVSHC